MLSDTWITAIPTQKSNEKQKFLPEHNKVNDIDNWRMFCGEKKFLLKYFLTMATPKPYVFALC